MTQPYAVAETVIEQAGGIDPDSPGTASVGLGRAVDEILCRRPAVGLAVGVVRRGQDVALECRGFADLETGARADAATVFRIGSLTKLFTAIAVMQLVEAARLDLDAPAAGYLRAYRLLPVDPSWRPATIRQLLTHTAGIPEVVHLADLMHPDWGPLMTRPAEASVPVGEPVPSLARYYSGCLRITTQPGTVFQYTNHGFATLGQIVADVTGSTLERWFRMRIFEPLGMTDSSLVRSDRIAAHLATGHILGRGGPSSVRDREWVCRLGAGGVYATARDLGRFTAALLGGGANGHGRILQPETLATMLEPHFQPDPRLPGRGLGFVRGAARGHRIVGHDGVLPGFNAQLLVAPDDGVGVFALTNGSSGAHEWLALELDGLLRASVGAPEDRVRADVPHHPETWGALCGHYRLAPGSDLRGRIALAAGADVAIRGGRPVLRIRVPFPALLRGLPLHPDADDDPYAFRLDLSALGMTTAPVVFGLDASGGVAAAHVDLGGQLLTFVKQDGTRGDAWSAAALGALAVAGVVATTRRRA